MGIKRSFRQTTRALIDSKRAFADDDEHARFRLAVRLAKLIYPKYKFSDVGRQFLDDKEFVKIYERFAKREDYHSLDRKYTLYNLMNLVVDLPGDTAECGVYNGGSSYFMCLRLKGTGKRHCVFDSFEGLSQPGSLDGTHWRKGNLAASEDVVRENLAEFDFVEYFHGWIPSRFSDVDGRSFCFVHIDVDLYEPTRDSIAFFYPRMVPGGIMLFDDYGFHQCPGARQASDEFFADKVERIVDLPTGQAFVIIAPK